MSEHDTTAEEFPLYRTGGGGANLTPDGRPLDEVLAIENDREENADILASPPVNQHLSNSSDDIEDKQVESEQEAKSQDQALGTAGETEVAVAVPPEYHLMHLSTTHQIRRLLIRRDTCQKTMRGKQKVMLREKKTRPGVAQYPQAKTEVPVV